MSLTQTASLARTPPQPADDAPHLLVVDDDRRIRDLLSRFLANEGYRVTTAMSAVDAPRQTARAAFRHADPRRDDARQIRLRPRPFHPHFLGGADHHADGAAEAESRIEGLQIGADDYVAKPFEPRELVLRIGNILKRATPVPVARPESISFGPYIYHLDRGELRQGEETIHLTDREREMRARARGGAR